MERLRNEKGQCDNDNRNQYKYVCITTYQPNSKSNSNPNPNPNPTTKQHAVVNIQLNIVICPTYPDKFIRQASKNEDVRARCHGEDRSMCIVQGGPI